MRSAEEYVNLAKTFAGCKQGDAKHKEIVDAYNSYKPLPRGVKMPYTSAWCACFVSSIAIMLGYTDIIPPECSCNKMIELFKIMGCWTESDSFRAFPGCLVFYDWDDDGKGDNVGTADHVGIVVEVKGNTFIVLEGNKGTNHECAYRTMNFDGRYIRGFGVPRFDEKPIVNPSVTKTETFAVGDKVKLKDGATYYNGKNIPSWVRKSTLYYRGDNANGCIVSILKIGAITGVVKREFLTKA